MLRSVEGVYRNGKVELAEAPSNIHDDTPVIVTFLEDEVVRRSVDEIEEAQATNLRARLRTFADDWDSPGMAIYDDYDKAAAQI